MFSRCPSIILLAILYACLLLNHQTVLSFTPSTISSARRHLQSTITQRYLFNIQSGSAKIPTSNTDRNSAAISSIKSAISKPRIPSCPLIECEFPPLQQINKLGDGSLRSAIEVEDANVEFVQKLIGGISTPFFGPNLNVILSSSASNALVKKVEKKVKGTKIYSLKEGLPEVNGKDEVCVFLTPSSQKDYQVARMLAENGVSTVLVNGSFKDQKSIPPNATMGYFVKPLTYNSQIAGYLIRAYPSPWTVLDATTKAVLKTFTDGEILVEKTNTPDLRESGRLVQKSVDERAIQARAGM